jgi:cobalt-zinc-cadmium efflux system protein
MAEIKQHNNHNHISVQADRPLKLTLIIVVVVMIAEAVGGILSNSLALLGDAGHMLTDALAIGLSLVAIVIARRPATVTKTFGYHRAEILAALFNGTVLVLISAYIFYEAYQRFSEPPTVNTPLMLIIAAAGLVTNLIGMLMLRRASHSSLNVRAAFWHIIGDTVSSVGVIIAGLIILVTGWYIADPIVSVLIGMVILWGAVRIVRESTDILLEATPKHIQMSDVIEALKDIQGVEDLHDIHIWTITSGIYALSAHLQIQDQMVSVSSDVLTNVNQVLSDNFDITHTTIQLECENCPTGLVCNLPSHAFEEAERK